MSLPPRLQLRDARRIVVKVGTAVVSRPDGQLALGRIGALVEQLCALRAVGREVLLVSSGAVGLGAERLGFDGLPRGLVDRQACAAAGQGALVSFYDALFSRLGCRCAQVLLTEEDFHHRRRHVNLAATLQRLLTLGAVPIINENDTVSTAELAFKKGEVFGDNDRLSALVASGIDCDALVLLSDVDGVFTLPPSDPAAQRIGIYGGESVRIGNPSVGGRGGMGAKLEASRMAARAGVNTVIANGYTPSVLSRVFMGDDIGTLFPAAVSLDSRRRWLAFATAPLGTVEVNVGARRALLRRASLLAPGVVSVVGEFEAGAVVSIACDGVEFARGICARSAKSLRDLKPTDGKSRPVVHADNVVVLEES